jgi:uncharacterized protein
MLLALLAAGYGGGLLAGLLGIGGGVLFVAVLPMVLQYVGVEQQVLVGATIANSLFGTFFSALASVWGHLKRGSLLKIWMLYLVVPTGISALIGIHLVVRQAWYSPQLFTQLVIGLLSLLLIRMIVTLFSDAKKVDGKAAVEVPPTPGLLIPLGVFAGIVSTTSGLGGGIITVPLLRWRSQLTAQRVSLLSSVGIMTTSFVALIDNVSAPSRMLAGLSLPYTGLIIWPIVLPLTIGVMIAAPLGVKLASGLSGRQMGILYLIFVTLVLARKVAELSGM